MCGIVGYVGNEQAWPIILDGLQRLEYRGYDSAGIAIVDSEGELHIRKTMGKVKDLAQAAKLDYPGGTIGLGHTRWATHGKPSDANAHPHTDCTGRVAVVHNGIVENFLALKQALQSQGHRFVSETDTEIIAHLVEAGLSEGLSFEDAFRRMGGQIQGSQAVAATSEGDEDKICVLRVGHAGGIVVAHRDGQGVIGSDLPAMLPVLRHNHHAEPVAFLDAGEMAVLSREGVQYQDLAGNPLNKQLRNVSTEEILVDKGGYRHFMLKEIMEQPQVVASALRGRVDFEKGSVDLTEIPISAADLKALQRVVLIGCGTSYHAAMVGRHLIERFAGIPAETESASEFRYRNSYIDDRTLVVSIGQSGETADTVAAMQESRDRGARLVTLCNIDGSQATRIAEGTMLMGSGIEIGVASTKTFIASLTLLNLLAIYLGEMRGVLSGKQTRTLVDDLSHCPRLVGELLAETAKYRRLARMFYAYKDFLFLGRGINAPIALEGALKLKEISYIHAEGYPAGEMKHGPIALIDESMATVALAPRDSLYEKMVGNIQEVKARDGVVLAVLTEGDEELASQVDEVFYIPDAPEHLVPMLATVPLQLLAYHIAVQLGCDVDQPRNLAKSVTVE